MARIHASGFILGFNLDHPMSPFIPNEPPASWVTCRYLVLTMRLLPASSDPRETQGPVPTCSGPMGALKPLVSTLGVTWLKL